MDTYSKPLMFKELEIGEHYISLPEDGDDSGHGGFRKGGYVFKKTGEFEGTRLVDGNLSEVVAGYGDKMKVYKVLL